MAEHMRAEPGQLRGYGELLERNAGHFKEIADYTTRVASDTSGFTGLLAVLVPAVEGVTKLYDEGLQHAHQALAKVRAELGHTAQHYEDAEQKISQALQQIESDLDRMRV